eukprot:CAMPEP_0185597316 /NCGR_PEP_ID=MMETSP0434-20130131/81294_1 /TAXON_ID=626734 ORGANISM="Favella taraikaensis, Strain Fe Narragansett Bay" /NCGR_SAMPLE_ID=MMETSP0434 /ASSEMBLY_ACC=CAM_ASM_000379 /LENGTH=68 /DNA_ID=CAMNT_0028226013 /DNA_START=523 /DNA_END=729 /DNA_ORIENTATION=-
MTAIRAVNQIIGRCIRHKNDYASIFLVDSRYNKPMNREKLSKWVKERLRQFRDPKELESELDAFFQRN